MSTFRRQRLIEELTNRIFDKLNTLNEDADIFDVIDKFSRDAPRRTGKVKGVKDRVPEESGPAYVERGTEVTRAPYDTTSDYLKLRKQANLPKVNRPGSEPVNTPTITPKSRTALPKAGESSVELLYPESTVRAEKELGQPLRPTVWTAIVLHYVYERLVSNPQLIEMLRTPEGRRGIFRTSNIESKALGVLFDSEGNRKPLKPISGGVFISHLRTRFKIERDDPAELASYFCKYDNAKEAIGNLTKVAREAFGASKIKVEKLKSLFPILKVDPSKVGRM